MSRDVRRAIGASSWDDSLYSVPCGSPILFFRHIESASGFGYNRGVLVFFMQDTPDDSNHWTVSGAYYLPLPLNPRCVERDRVQNRDQWCFHSNRNEENKNHPLKIHHCKTAVRIPRAKWIEPSQRFWNSSEALRLAPNTGQTQKHNSHNRISSNRLIQIHD